MQLAQCRALDRAGVPAFACLVIFVVAVSVSAVMTTTASFTIALMIPIITLNAA